MAASPTRHRSALVIALVGVALSLFTLGIHRRLSPGSGFTSFCNLGGVVDCDLVLSSRYGHFAGVSVAAWATAAFAGGALLAVPGAFGGATGGLVDLALLGLVSASAGFALVLLGIALIALRHLCLLCLGLDAVIAAWLVAVVPLVGRFGAPPERRW